MGLIYEPRSPAREYAELALNLYKGCTHGCKYCYAPNFAYMGESPDKREALFEKAEIVGRKKDSTEQRIERALKRLKAAVPNYKNGPRVLMSFISDPYQPAEDELKLTKRAIEIMGEAGVGMTILTKAATKALRDWDLFLKYNIEIAQTICWKDDEKRKEWEPNASSIPERLELLAKAKAAGLPTWISIEPIIDPNETLDIIDELIGKTDLLKIGVVDRRWNPNAHSAVHWTDLLKKVLAKVDGKQHYYIKDSLWEYADDEVKETWKKEWR